ncbi:WhiB family transcriptional regulator [Streptomyces sp. AC627_RSS907]|uniref:WhiB family transcriptional regulator n=1 Tax=Streptomyces sp. AC627_RSS907 TaxID=2823684 RepID=UPI001C21D337|nr:WhiB family transcriptional regulator [Streptomyces sp. AC627_RSS907]
MDWRDRGLCLREDPDLFFPIGNINSGQVVIQTDQAKSVCRRCPVTQQCLAWAFAVGPVEGVWGGMTEGERRAARRRAARRPAVTKTAA